MDLNIKKEGTTKRVSSLVEDGRSRRFRVELQRAEALACPAPYEVQDPNAEVCFSTQTWVSG